MDKIFILETWIYDLLNKIADASANDTDFTLHMTKDEVKQVQKEYASTVHIEIY